MFFIAGITGNVGGAAARLLLSNGKRVRSLLRTPQKAQAFADQGVELLEGDLNDPVALARALEGVEGAFLLMHPILAPSPDFREARATLASYTQALTAVPVPRLVALSSMGSEKPERLGNITSTALMESAFADLPFPTAFVRAGSFYENYAGALAAAQHTGQYFSFPPIDLAYPSVGTVDIGNEAARLLLEDWTGRRIVELGSLITARQIAAAIGQALGREVQAQSIPREDWALALERFGLLPGSTGPYEQMMESIANGWISFGQPGTESVVATQTLEEFFQSLVTQ